MISLSQKFLKLGPWERIGAIGALASIIAIPLTFYMSSPTGSAIPQIHQSAGASATQIASVQGNVTINSSNFDKLLGTPQEQADIYRDSATAIRESLRRSKGSTSDKGWKGAEIVFLRGEDHYSRRDYQHAENDFKIVMKLYQEIMAKQIAHMAVFK